MSNIVVGTSAAISLAVVFGLVILGNIVTELTLLRHGLNEIREAIRRK